MTFLNPSLLWFLLLLPSLWALFKIKPPKAIEQSFPPIHFLYALKTTTQNRHYTPWWLMILRLLICACLIIGLAQPVFYMHDFKTTSSEKPILLMIDNGWSSSPQWPQFIQVARQILIQANQNHTSVDLLLTAHNQDNQPLALLHTKKPIDLINQLDILHPFPWPVDHQETASLLQKLSLSKSYQKIYYLSDSTTYDVHHPLKTIVQNLPPIYEIRPQSFVDTPNSFLLRKPIQSANQFVQPIEILPKPITQTIHIQIYDQQNNLISSIEKNIPPKTSHSEVTFELPKVIQQKIKFITINPLLSAGSIYFLNREKTKPVIGLLQNSNTADTPFTGSLYYLKNALVPLGTVREDSLQNLFTQAVSILITPDTVFTDHNTITSLQKWLKQGGILIRFSGPVLANYLTNQSQSITKDPFLPLPLSGDIRVSEGEMTWEKPQNIQEFSNHSPFFGLTIAKNITVNKQILPQSQNKLHDYSWAQLQDGTPLVTHRAVGKGQIIFFHIDSTTTWSNLPLSGLFISMLERLIALSSTDILPHQTTPLHLLKIIDQQGIVQTPKKSIAKTNLTQLYQTFPSPLHPPGIYGDYQSHYGLNLGNTLPSFKIADPIGKVITFKTAFSTHAIGNDLILFSFLLLLIDMILKLLSLSNQKYNKTFIIFLFLTITLFNSPHSVQAQPIPQSALHIKLAYILTDHPLVDQLSKEGLEGLSQFISQKTTLHLAGPDGVNPVKDDIRYYPLLYWPITKDIQTDPQRDKALNSYLNHGGILVLDTQGHDPESSIEPIHPDHFAGEASGHQTALKKATENLAIPALSLLSDQHIISKSFYILHDFPGQYDAMPVWISQSEPSVNDGVSSVIIGENNWAYAWASLINKNLMHGFFPNTERQRALSYHFGLNLVIYALTGNYKADQIHASTLIKRMGTHP